MAEDSAQPALLILLIGSNPLPNFLTACALKPQKIALIHTPETEKVSERLRQSLAKALGAETETVPEAIEDAASAHQVARRVGELVREGRQAGRVVLNYTGGTKVMAAHALRAFVEAGGSPDDSCYLDDGGPGASPRLRFDNGTFRTLEDCGVQPLAFETLLGLHGARLQRLSPREPAPRADDAKAMAQRILAQPPLAQQVYEAMQETFGRESDPKKLTGRPFDATKFCVKLSIGPFPTEAQIEPFSSSKADRESWFKQWRRFVGGGWLEDWVAERIEKTGLFEDGQAEPVSGFQVFRGDRSSQLEIDIAVVRNYRSYFISCTTARDKGTCKQKLFEIAVRARQLAGDLARAALVCLAEGNTLNQLRDEVDDEEAGGMAYRVPGAAAVRVFGLEDLHPWAGWAGAAPNLETLKGWLES